ncbi:MAG TPA: hypothetical protein PLF31_03305 [Candidatus Paceibacterota bacterium]|nr:hypothetical protein [Candidatus Paceibacterota bacterium]
MFRNLVIIVGVIVLFAGGFFAYTEFFVAEPAVLSVEELGDDFVGKDVIIELEKIRNVNFSNTLFSDPAYQSLVDGTIHIVDEPKGRPNPFAPIGAGVQSVVIRASSTRTTPAR